MSQSPLPRKLLVKPGNRVAILGDPGGYRQMLDPLPDGVRVVAKPSDDADVVLVFVRNAADVDKHAAVIRSAKPRAMLWLAYPKGGKKSGTDLNRDILWELMQRFGLAGTTLVAVDETWSAMRFRPTDQVGR
jgi:hypothetical protein